MEATEEKQPDVELVFLHLSSRLAWFGGKHYNQLRVAEEQPLYQPVFKGVRLLENNHIGH